MTSTLGREKHYCQRPSLRANSSLEQYRRGTALQAATEALEAASWLVLLWVLQERASWLQVSCICYKVQAGIVEQPGGRTRNSLLSKGD